MNILIAVLLLLVPGYFILSFSSEKRSIWLNLVYSHALSLVFLIVTGLIINTLLPLIGIAKPLDAIVIQPLVYGAITLLGISCLILGRFNVFGLTTHIKKFFEFTPIQLILLILSLFPMTITVIGTLMLNNHYSNTVMVAGLTLLAGQIFTSFLFATFFSNKTFFYLVNLLLIGAGIIFLTSLRGMHVTGSDIMLEYRMAAVTQQQRVWSPNNPLHPYTACLSITILPVVVSNLSGVPLTSLYKVFLQLATILSVVPVYFVARKFVGDKASYAAALAFITFPSFFGIMPMHLRQSAAILFFFLSIHVIISGKKALINHLFLYFFAFGMIVSHYSTTYLATAIYIVFFLSSIVIFLITKIISRLKQVDVNFEEFHLFRHVNVIFLVFLFAVIYVWYFKVTNLSAGLTNFVNKVSYSFSSDSTLDIREDTSLVNQFNIFFKKTQEAGVADEYLNKVVREYKLNNVEGNNTFYKFPIPYVNDFKIETLHQELMKPNVPSSYLQPILIGADLVKKTYKVLTIIGVLFVAFSLIVKKEKKYSAVYLMTLGIAFSLLIAFTSLPLFTLDYDVFRTYHQLLIVLALMPVLGLTILLRMLKVPFYHAFVIIFFVFYFSLSTGLFYQLLGGYSYSLTLNNKGDDFDRYYIREGEALSVKWIESNRDEYSPIHTDTYTKQKLRALSIDPLPVYDELTQLSITQMGYVFLTTSNLENGAAYKNLNNRLIKHRIPVEFIAEKKDKIYSNTKSEIYK